MPFISHTLLTSGAGVWLWHLTETKKDFESLLSDGEIAEVVEKFPHESRQLQKLATRLLLKRLNPTHNIDIQHDELGAPSLAGTEGHISISHTRQFVGLLFHPLERCGLDLEEVSPRVLKIAHRFLNDREKAWIRADNQLSDTTLVWSTKEALFKTLGGGGIHFAADLIVYEPVFINKTEGHGRADYRGHKGAMDFVYRFKYLDGVLMVHTIAKRTKSDEA